MNDCVSCAWCAHTGHPRKLREGACVTASKPHAPPHPYELCNGRVGQLGLISALQRVASALSCTTCAADAEVLLSAPRSLRVRLLCLRCNDADMLCCCCCCCCRRLHIQRSTQSQHAACAPCGGSACHNSLLQILQGTAAELALAAAAASAAGEAGVMAVW
jgi:hypothetical protein